MLMSLFLSKMSGWFIASHKWLYNRTNGRIGSSMAGIEHLLLRVKGRKSGKIYEHPLACFRDGDALIVVASRGGDDVHPAWYLNLCASPDVELQLGSETQQRTARTANASERERLWPDLVKQNPMYRTYQKRTEREIPVVLLESLVG